MKHLVITGGNGGLAQAITTGFSDPEWRISAPSRMKLDVTDAAAIPSFFENRQVDLLICAAGVIRDAPLAKMQESAWDEIFAVNYRGAIRCANAVLPAMQDRGIGHVIFISSFSALHPPIGQIAYATAKAALLGFTEESARENGRHGIRVNAIFPGFLETPMTDSVSAARKSEILAAHVMGRFNTCATVAKFIRHLQEDLPHTSGQSFQLDSRIS